MKKGKKMPSIELEGHSEATFVLVDGKIVRNQGAPRGAPPTPPAFGVDRSMDRMDRMRD